MKKLGIALAVVAVAATLEGALGISDSSAQAADTSYHPVTPARVLDTRPEEGAVVDDHNEAVAPDTAIFVKLLGRGGVPTSGVSTVVVNMTITAPTASGHVTVYPSDELPPGTSNANFLAGETVANLVMASVGPDGQVAVYKNPGGSAHIIFDVVGGSQATSRSFLQPQLESSTRGPANSTPTATTKRWALRRRSRRSCLGAVESPPLASAPPW